MTIRDYVSNLSKEEMELHKELIEECIQRENQLNEVSEYNLECLTAFMKSMDNFSNQVIRLDRELNILSGVLEEYYEITVPDENHYEGLLLN